MGFQHINLGDSVLPITGTVSLYWGVGIWEIFTSIFSVQYKNKHLKINFFVFQPKSEDEEGWKKFCLGERLCAEGAVGPATNESPGIDYVQVGNMWINKTKSILILVYHLV